MRAFWLVFLKELRDAVRDRRTLRAVLLSALLPGPVMLLLISTLVGDLERHAESRQVMAVGIEHAPTLRNYIERQTWTIAPAPADHERQLRSRQLGETVLVVPEDFEARLAQGDMPTLTLVSDSANQRAATSRQRLQGMLSGFAQERGLLALSLRGVSPALLQPVDLQVVDLADPAARAANLTGMLPFVILMAVVSGALAAALDSTAGERERGSLEPLLMNPVPYPALVAGKWAAVALLGMAIAVLCCLSFLPGQWLLRSDQLAAMFRFGPGEAAAFIGLLLPLAGLMAAALMAVAIHGRTVKEAQASASLLVLGITFLPLVSMLNPGGEKPWQLWLPVIAQSTLMNRVLRGESINAPELLAPAALCGLLTVLMLGLVVRQFKRLAAR